jgi:heme ABC exporter ATP-binding subunit CcmA
LAHFDARISPGEVVLVAGHNGSGKTTFLRMVAGLYRPTSGELRVFGLDPSRDRLATRRRLSLVSHDAYLYDRLTAAETLRLWARLVGRPLTPEEVLEHLRQVSLEGAERETVGGFSAGMRKRLALARLRIEEPDLVLLDEPFSALDQEGKRLVEGWVREARQRGSTVLLASHDIERACALADRALWLRSGQLYWSGAAGELPALFREGREGS